MPLSKRALFLTTVFLAQAITPMAGAQTVEPNAQALPHSTKPVAGQQTSDAEKKLQDCHKRYAELAATMPEFIDSLCAPVSSTPDRMFQTYQPPPILQQGPILMQPSGEVTG